MKINKFKKLLLELELDYKKEVIKIAIFNIVTLISVVLVNVFIDFSFLTLSISLLAFVVVNIVIFYNYSDKKRKLISDHDDEFIYIISIFETFISNNNNVYQTFNKMLDYSSSFMREKIEILLSEIDEDKSVQPFVNFAKNFTIRAANNLMISIYQMVDMGESLQALTHFTILFTQINETKHQEQIKKKEKSFDFVLMCPMLGAALITVLLSICIIGMMGEFINVI